MIESSNTLAEQIMADNKRQQIEKIIHLENQAGKKNNHEKSYI